MPDKTRRDLLAALGASAAVGLAGCNTGDGEETTEPGDGGTGTETATTTVPANDYTLEVRGDTEDNDGDVVADFDVSLDGGTVYTAFATGYLTPDDEPVDAPFDLQVAQDASY